MTEELSEDLQLWLLLKQGNDAAFAMLFEKYHPLLYNYGMKLVSGRADLVEDAVQDLFIDLWRLRGGLTEKVASVKFYLYRSLRRKLHLMIKAENTLEALDSDHPHCVENSYETLLIRREGTQAVASKLAILIDQLPKRQKEALTLRYFEGFSNQDIARIMDVNEKSVRNFLYKALTALKSHQEWIVVSGVFLIALNG